MTDIAATFSSPATGDGSARKAATASTCSLISGLRSTLSPPWPAVNAAAGITTGPGDSRVTSVAARGACGGLRRATGWHENATRKGARNAGDGQEGEGACHDDAHGET